MSRGIAQEFLVKLLIAIVVVIALFVLGIRLISLFWSGPEQSSAAQSLRLLGERIAIAQKTGESRVTTIVALPASADRHYIISTMRRDQKTHVFLMKNDLKQTVLRYTVEIVSPQGLVRSLMPSEKTVEVPRPSACKEGKSCVCIWQHPRQDASIMTPDSFNALACKSFDYDTMDISLNSDDPMPVVLQLDISATAVLGKALVP